jgi:hypothetical protein
MREELVIMANHTNSKKGRFGTTMGVPSIIAILVILVLIVFSALSIMTAKADLNLSEKTAASIRNYYKADSEAEDRLAEAVDAVKNGKSDVLPDIYQIKKVDGGTQVVYNIPIDQGKGLSVELLITDSGKATRKLWQVVSTTDWKPDTNVELFQ